MTPNELAALTDLVNESGYGEYETEEQDDSTDQVDATIFYDAEDES